MIHGKPTRFMAAQKHENLLEVLWYHFADLELVWKDLNQQKDCQCFFFIGGDIKPHGKAATDRSWLVSHLKMQQGPNTEDPFRRRLLL